MARVTFVTRGVFRPLFSFLSICSFYDDHQQTQGILVTLATRVSTGERNHGTRNKFYSSTAPDIGTHFALVMIAKWILRYKSYALRALIS